jgi:mRNA interferase HicA
MKRRDLIRHLEQSGCYLDREGADHSIYRNPRNGRCAAVPRHCEINDNTARKMQIAAWRMEQAAKLPHWRDSVLTSNEGVGFSGGSMHDKVVIIVGNFLATGSHN